VSNPSRKAPKEENTVQSKLVRGFTITNLMPILTKSVYFVLLFEFPKRVLMVVNVLRQDFWHISFGLESVIYR
jgi:hypothetical protein